MELGRRMRTGRPRIDQTKLDKAISLYLGGASLDDIESISGIGHSTIYRELDKRGIPKRSKKASR